MNRLENIVRTNELEVKRIVVTGCGYRPLKYTFYDVVTGETSHDAIFVDGREMKLNIGAAVAGVLAKSGATVHMVSTSEDKLDNIKQEFSGHINPEQVEYSALDLLSEDAVKDFVVRLPKDKPFYWVQSVGLGAGSYKLKDDNPYLPLEEIPIELLEKESQTVLCATHLMMKEFLPRFREQDETRIALVSSMSAIRGYSYGGTHCAAKGAIDRYANAAMLALYKDNIFVTTVRPGGVDTGMYDNPVVQEAIKIVSDEYGGNYRMHQTYAPPIEVGKLVKEIFTIGAHIPSVNFVARGQMPNEGS